MGNNFRNEKFVTNSSKKSRFNLIYVLNMVVHTLMLTCETINLFIYLYRVLTSLHEPPSSNYNALIKVGNRNIICDKCFCKLCRFLL